MMTFDNDSFTEALNDILESAIILLEKCDRCGIYYYPQNKVSAKNYKKCKKNVISKKLL